MVHLLDPEDRDPLDPAYSPIERRASDDHITDELDAISTIDQVLASLPDTAARVRVLRWAAERFEINASMTAALAPTPASAVDQTLSVDGLQDLFAAAPVKDTRAHLSSDDTLGLHDMLPPQVATPIAATIVAAVDNVDNSQLALEIESLDLDAPAVEQPAAEQPAAAALDAQRAESLIHSFVADLQRLAQDCQTVFAPASTTPQ